MTTTQTISRERLEHYSALPTQPFGEGAEVFMYEVRQMARMLLAAYEQEPVMEVRSHFNGEYVCRKMTKGTLKPGVMLYAAPPAQIDDIASWSNGKYPPCNEPAPVAVQIPPEKPHTDGPLADGWNACRAAMLNCATGVAPGVMYDPRPATAGSSMQAEPVTAAKVPDDFICRLTGRAEYLREKGEIKSPELLERAASALKGENASPHAIPNGWKLVPIDPTKDMLRAGQSVVGFWLNTVHCYSKMLAAAPSAPEQEV